MIFHHRVIPNVRIAFFRRPSFVLSYSLFTAVLFCRTASIAKEIFPVEEKQAKKMLIGLGGDLGYNALTANYYFNFSGNAACGIFTKGSGLKPNFRLFVETPLANSLGLRMQVGYNNFSGRLETLPLDTAPTYINGSLVHSERVHQYDLSLSALSFSLFSAWQLPGSVEVIAGPTIALPLSHSFEQRETILSPENLIYLETGSPTRKLAEGEISAGLMAAINLMISYPLYVKNNFTLSPTASILFPLTKVNSHEQFKISTYGVGANLTWSPSIAPEPIPEPVVPPPPPPPPVVPRVYALDASVEVFGLTHDNERVPIPPLKIQRTIIREEFNLLATVFFEEGESVVPSRYNILKDGGETNAFVAKDLPRDALIIHHNVVNVIGERLRGNPSATITITGATSNTGIETSQGEKLAGERAEAVKKYLVAVWSLAPERIVIEARKLPEVPSPVNTVDGQQENRRVNITSDEYEIIRPLELLTTEYSVNPPRLAVLPKVFADTTIISYKLDIRTRKQILISFTGDASQLSQEAQSWKITPEMIEEDEDSLRVVLFASDAVGQNVEASTAIPLLQGKNTTKSYFAERQQDKLIERFSLITFDFDKETLPQLEMRKLEAAVTGITPLSTITVSGFTDRTGLAKRNEILARDRAKHVAELLRDGATKHGVIPASIDVKWSGGVETYDNNLPEGRFLSRTVKIEIVKSIQ